MRFEFEWIGIPDSGDWIESRTWARLSCSAGGSTITRAHDRLSKTVGESIYVPLYPLATWIVGNWWSLFYEPWPFVSPLPGPGAGSSPDVLEWWHRHCLRAASPGYAGPYAFIFSQGRDIVVATRPDPPGLNTRIQLEFTADGECLLDREEVRSGLAEFVESVLRKLEDFPDERVEALRAGWQAICNMSASEAEFCRAAGRLGLDPHACEEWPAGVLEWFEAAPEGELDRALMIDLLEAPDPVANKRAQHEAIVRVMHELGLGPAANAFGPPISTGTAFSEGYALAAWLRGKLGLAEDGVLADVREASAVACGRSLVIHDSAPIPEGHVFAVVGWRANPGPVVATRRMGAPASARFLAGRALYLALHGATDGPRLVTDARTWVQRASRAFGAELLAPRAGVQARYFELEARHGPEDAQLMVADHYRVSSWVVLHQLENCLHSTPG